MQNFLFGNKRTTCPKFSPFGNTQVAKSGIITKIKNKITDLFKPQINSSSVVQRIQQDLIQEEELNLQFENNFFLIDCINPSKEESRAEKRKILYPFEKYLQDENKKVSKESQTDIPFQSNQRQVVGERRKRLLKFKKNHAKIEKERKMEGNNQYLLIDNPRQLQFKQQDAEENSIQKRIKTETNHQILESSFHIPNIQFFDSNSMTSLKRQPPAVSEKQEEIQKSIKKSSQNNFQLNTSTSNTKEEEQSSLISLPHEDQSIIQESLVASDETSSNSIEISNPLFCFFNSAKQTVKINSESKSSPQQKLSNRNKESLNDKQELSSVKKQQKLTTPFKNEKLSSVKKQSTQLNSEPKQTQHKEEIIIEQSQHLAKINEDIQQQLLNDSNMMITNNNQSLDSQSISQNFIQESSTNQLLDKQIQKDDQQNRKENNPFLQSSTLISQDQIHSYFQTGYSNPKTLPQQTFTQNLFKVNNNTTSLFNFNQPPQYPLSDNPKIIQYSTNKQMEIVEQETSQKVNQPTWMNQNLSLQHQSLFQQAQQQCQYQLSSLTLFSSNPYLASHPQQQQDVLSLFKDPQKQEKGNQKFQDIDLFSTEIAPQQNHLNNSFNKGNRKKQRINNF